MQYSMPEHRTVRFLIYSHRNIFVVPFRKKSAGNKLGRCVQGVYSSFHHGRHGAQGGFFRLSILMQCSNFFFLSPMIGTSTDFDYNNSLSHSLVKFPIATRRIVTFTTFHTYVCDLAVSVLSEGLSALRDGAATFIDTLLLPPQKFVTSVFCFYWWWKIKTYNIRVIV